MRFLFCVATILVLSYFQHIVECRSTKKTNDTSPSDKRYFVIESLKDWLKTNIHGFSRKCFEKKDKGGQANAEMGDSPIKNFGFPTVHVVKGKGVFQGLDPGFTLSLGNKHYTPIRLGSRDYIFVGKPNALLAFCECFEEYPVIGSKLMDNGHWKENQGGLKIQLQNVQSFGTGPNDDVGDLIFKYTLDRITKHLDPNTVISNAANDLMGDIKLTGLNGVKDVLSQIDKIREWLPYTEAAIKKMSDIIVKNVKNPKEAKKKVIDYLNDQQPEQKKWIGLRKNVIDKSALIIATLTMYEKPEIASGTYVRATYNFGKSTVTMKDIGRVLVKAFEVLN